MPNGRDLPVIVQCFVVLHDAIEDIDQGECLADRVQRLKQVNVLEPAVEFVVLLVEKNAQLIDNDVDQTDDLLGLVVDLLEDTAQSREFHLSLAVFQNVLLLLIVLRMGAIQRQRVEELLLELHRCVRVRSGQE